MRFGMDQKAARQAAQDIANCQKCSFGMSISKVQNKGTNQEYWMFRNPRLCKMHHEQLIEGGNTK